MKICSKCGILYSKVNFYKDKAKKDGFRPDCKHCNSKQRREYVGKNKTKVAETNKSWRENNRDRVSEYHRNYHQENKIKKQRYYQENKQYFRDYARNKYQSDTNYKLASRLRHRLYNALKGSYKSGSAVRDLGCSIEELRLYLESKFQLGMSWDNHGEWHIDHIKPLASFDLTDREQLLEACNYKNLQPLWARENLEKR